MRRNHWQLSATMDKIVHAGTIQPLRRSKDVAHTLELRTARMRPNPSLFDAPRGVPFLDSSYYSKIILSKATRSNQIKTNIA